MKRACIIITDFARVVWDDANPLPGVGMGPWEAPTSPQLLADLYLLMRYAEKNETYGTWTGDLADNLADATARVRAAIGDGP